MALGLPDLSDHRYAEDVKREIMRVSRKATVEFNKCSQEEGFVDGLMSYEEALFHAERMKEEREAFWNTHDKQWFSLPFNIWEN